MSARNKSSQEPEVEVKQFTLEEIEIGIKKITKRIEDVEKLLSDKVRYDDQRNWNVKGNIVETIRDIFGSKSPEFKKYQHHSIWHGPLLAGDSDYSRQMKFEAGVPQTVTMLKGLIESLEEKKEFLPSEGKKISPQTITALSDDIFIVHGHSNEAKQTLARFIEKLGLNAIILHEKPSLGKTLIEKFETFSNVGFAIVLLTPDDEGRAFGEDILNPRARQNVVFEMGFFVGRIGRERVCIIYGEGVELPSDYDGVAYIPMDASGAWKMLLAKEMKHIGFEIDMNKVFFKIIVD